MLKNIFAGCVMLEKYTIEQDKTPEKNGTKLII